jgi:hypothetical protein
VALRDKGYGILKIGNKLGVGTAAGRLGAHLKMPRSIKFGRGRQLSSFNSTLAPF